MAANRLIIDSRSSALVGGCVVQEPDIQRDQLETLDY